MIFCSVDGPHVGYHSFVDGYWGLFSLLSTVSKATKHPCVLQGHSAVERIQEGKGFFSFCSAVFRTPVCIAFRAVLLRHCMMDLLILPFPASTLIT